MEHVPIFGTDELFTYVVAPCDISEFLIADNSRSHSGYNLLIMLGVCRPVGADPEGELKKALKDELVGITRGFVHRVVHSLCRLVRPLMKTRPWSVRRGDGHDEFEADRDGGAR
jgi:hypothetical protein